MSFEGSVPRDTKANILAAAAAKYSAGELVGASDTSELFLADGANAPQAVSRSFNSCGNPTSSGYVLPWNLISTANSAAASGTLALFPFDIWPGPLTLKALAVQVTTAQSGGTGTATSLALYRDNGTGAGPLMSAAGLLASGAITATAVAVAALTVSLTLRPGRYWAGALYYAGSVAPTTAPQFVAATSTTTLWAASLAPTRHLTLTGLTAVPTSGTPTPGALSTQPVVGLQAA